MSCRAAPADRSRPASWRCRLREAAVALSTALGLLGPATNADAGLPETIAQIKPSIVVVGSYRSSDSPRFGMRGTGFVVAPGNLVVTNAHVLGRGVTAESAARPDAIESVWVVQVRSGDGPLQTRQASVIETDAAHDLALLQIEGPALPSLLLQDSDAVREGESVAFIGFPIGGVLGYSPVTHRGLVSSIAPVALPAANGQQLNPRLIRSLRAGSFDIFQLDGTAYPGNSGGPLFDPGTGGVLGVVNMVFVKSTRESVLAQPSGISYAIPSNHVRDLLKRHGMP